MNADELNQTISGDEGRPVGKAALGEASRYGWRARVLDRRADLACTFAPILALSTVITCHHFPVSSFGFAAVAVASVVSAFRWWLPEAAECRRIERNYFRVDGDYVRQSGNARLLDLARARSRDDQIAFEALLLDEKMLMQNKYRSML